MNIEWFALNRQEKRIFGIFLDVQPELGNRKLHSKIDRVRIHSMLLKLTFMRSSLNPKSVHLNK